MANDRGSALVITLLLLVILTAIGIYAISLSTTEMGMAMQSQAGTSAFHAAEAGVNYGIDNVPGPLVTNSGSEYCDGTMMYCLSLAQDNVLSVRPGFRGNDRFVDYTVFSRSSGSSSPLLGSGAPQRSVTARIDYGPVPSGTMYE